MSLSYTELQRKFKNKDIEKLVESIMKYWLKYSLN